MTKAPNKFLAAMGKVKEEPAPEPQVEAPTAPVAKPKTARAGQKHLGAYFEKADPILERVAILRARLDMTNSELIEHALNELWARHEASRKFGD